MAVHDAAPLPEDASSTRGDGQPTPETTPTEETLSALRELRRLAPESAPVADQAIATIERLREEVFGLRFALTSRAAIDEAKGILMAERGCDEESAFQILTQLSQDTNVPVRDVARAIVYKAQDPD